MKQVSVLLITLLILSSVPIKVAASENVLSTQTNFIRNQELAYLTFEELKKVSKHGPYVVGSLKSKLETFFEGALINNEAYFEGIQPHAPKSPLLGDFLRVTSWNIEKSLNVDRAIQLWKQPKEFLRMIDHETAIPGSEEYLNVLKQRERLIQADIILLQEMEIGVKRSKYWNAAAKLAEALNMNYAFAPQYLEVDPVQLGTEQLYYDDGKEDKEAMDYYKVDPEKFKGVFGSAVLSRYPIKHVEVRPLKYQAYDWYEGEKKRVTFLEKARRFGAKTTFKNELTREIKVGGRHYFRVDLHVPQLPNDTLTIINVHLEIKCLPRGREEQMREVLGYIKDIKNPVIMMGDFNASSTDLSPTSVARVAKRTAKNPTTWLNAAVNYISPQGLAINTTRGASNITKNFNDPFATDVKVLAPNPLKRMFEMIRDFRFSDGKAFDFRGDPNRSINNKDKLLANSNQRGFKGFKTSFSVKRALGVVGKYRLDWAFVKSYLYDPYDSEFGSYRFAPHFGETLEEMNTSLKEPISDHHPNIIDLPFGKPRI